MEAGRRSETRWTFRILGRFEVLRDGAPLRDVDLGSRKQRALLKLLLVDRGHVVSVERIVEALWTEPPARPHRIVATLVSRLRATFGREVVEGGVDGYRLVAGRDVAVDLDEAVGLVAEAERRIAAGEFALGLAAAEHAEALLASGPVFEEEPYAEWLSRAREEGQRLCRTAHAARWRAALAAGDADAALEAAHLAVGADAFDEEAHRALMSAHAAAGRRAEALAAYERLRDALWLELSVEPAPETRVLAAEIAGTTVAGEDPRPPRAGGPPGAGAAGPPRQAPEAPEPLDPAFVGREREMASVDVAWKAAVAGRPRMVLLSGEAGIGKTTLAARLVSLARSTGGLVLESRCYEAERSLFLQPIADAIRPLVLRSSAAALRALLPEGGAGLARLLPELGAALAGPGGPAPATAEPAIPELERRRAFEGAADLLRALSGRHPVLLYLDDLHLAGAATLEFLHFLVRRASPSRLLVLATARVEEGEEIRRALGEVAETLEIGPLPADSVMRLANVMGGLEFGPQVIERTRGHPLFVVEMLRALAERPPGSAGVAAAPETLRAAIIERVGRAGADVAGLLSAASILGSTFDLGLTSMLLEVSGEEGIRLAERAHRARLIVPAGGDFAFSNDLVHEIVYDAVPLPIRTYRHRRAASLLAGRPELVAHHAYAAGDWANAASSWLAAAQLASRHYANVDAEELLGRALEAARRGGTRDLEARARLARGRVLETLGRYEEAVADAAAAVATAREIGDRRLEMEGLRDMGGDPIVALGRTPADCVPNLDAARRIAEELGERAFAIDILRRLAVIETNDLDGAAARRHADAALASAEAAGDERSLAVALDATKTVAAYVGDVSRLEVLVMRLRPILERGDMPWFLQWTVFESSFVSLARADWPAASRRIAEALELNRRSGYHAYQAMFLAQRAWIEAASGYLGDALDSAEAAARIAEDVGHPWWRAFVASVHGRLLVTVGAFGEAASVLERGLEIADRDGTRMYVLRCLGPLAEAHALAGNLDRAADLAERASTMVPPAAPRPVFLHAAEGPLSAARAWIALDRHERAVPILREVEAAASAAGWAEPLVTSSLALGQIHERSGGIDEAVAAVRRALDVAAGRLPVLEADAHAALARLVNRRAPGARGARYEAAAQAGYLALLESLGAREVRGAYERVVAERLAAAPAGRR